VKLRLTRVLIALSLRRNLHSFTVSQVNFSNASRRGIAAEAQE
jgi:hypothetical protein